MTALVKLNLDVPNQYKKVIKDLICSFFVILLFHVVVCLLTDGKLDVSKAVSGPLLNDEFMKLIISVWLTILFYRLTVDMVVEVNVE
jgi:hypothetical protein